MPLPPLRVGPSPVPCRTAEDFRDSLTRWTQDYHFALREIEKYLREFQPEVVVSTTPSTTSSVDLVGPAGDPGPQGEQGDIGVPGQTGLAGPAGPTGATGAIGTSGPAWLVGIIAPSAASGNNQDFYLNRTTGDIYQKQSGVWTLVANSRGAEGAAVVTKAGKLYASVDGDPFAANRENLIMDTVAFDTGGMTDAAARRLTFPVAGYYLVTAQVTIAANPVGFRQLIMARGIIGQLTLDFIGMSVQGNAGTERTVLNASGVVNMLPNNYVSATFGENSGASISYIGGAANTFMAAYHLGS